MCYTDTVIHCFLKQKFLDIKKLSSLINDKLSTIFLNFLLSISTRVKDVKILKIVSSSSRSYRSIMTIYYLLELLTSEIYAKFLEFFFIIVIGWDCIIEMRK
uniref:Uncharacterized protein n=1 Tax=Rhizophagus irregularis (strain DAOM 181602 / DAOM 197198 / MUCL 43194) TaxID=747089 RepID=U9SUI0_RHIID